MVHERLKKKITNKLIFLLTPSHYIVQHATHREAAHDLNDISTIVFHCWDKFINIFHKFYRISRVYFNYFKT